MALADSNFIVVGVPTGDTPNGRQLAVGDGLTLTDGGPGTTETINFEQPYTSLGTMVTSGLVAYRNAGPFFTPVTLTAGSGITITNGDGVGGNPTISQTAGTVSQKVFVGTNPSGGALGTYPRINFVAGAGITLTATDFGAGAAANINISASAEVQSAVQVANTDNNVAQPTYGRLNFLGANGIDVTLAAGVAANSVNVTIGSDSLGTVQAATVDNLAPATAYERLNFLVNDNATNASTFAITPGSAAESANVTLSIAPLTIISDSVTPADPTFTVGRLNFIGGGTTTVNVATSQGGTFGDVTITSAGGGFVSSGFETFVDASTLFTDAGAIPPCLVPFGNITVANSIAAFFVSDPAMTESGVCSAWAQGANGVVQTLAAQGHISTFVSTGFPGQDPSIAGPGLLILSGDATDIGKGVAYVVISQ